MSKILVTCPGCLARFEVSDKYAGKKGPCPKCKKEIIVPDKQDEVVIHAPADSGPTDSKGVAVLKPIKRTEFAVGKLIWIAVAVGVIATLGFAISMRLSNTVPSTLLLVIGSILLAPPIVMFGYTFLRDDEFDGYSGQEYLIRTAICSILFAATWLFYWQISAYFENKVMADIPTGQMAVFMIVMIAIGTVTSLATFELETPQAAAHYLAYFVVTFLLCWMMRVELAEPIAAPKSLNVPRSTLQSPPAVKPAINPLPSNTTPK
ncbi:MAG: hypothetical protein NTW52_06160 [Planctomycetota bacterium]|nr:hypothetical protein [Planctomycetota bacterium]